MRQSAGTLLRVVGFVVAVGLLIAPVGLYAPSQLVVEALTLPVVAFLSWVLSRRLPRGAVGSRAAIVGSGMRGLALGLVWISLPLAAVLVTGHAALTGVWPALARVALGGLVTLLNAATQEVLFRGYVFSVVEARHRARSAVFATTALFVAVHLGAAWQSPLALINLTLAGALFGVARDRTGGLTLPIAMHFAWNVVIGPVLGLTVSGSHALSTGVQAMTLGGPVWLSGGAFGIEASFATTVATAALLLSAQIHIPRVDGRGRLERAFGFIDAHLPEEEVRTPRMQ